MKPKVFGVMLATAMLVPASAWAGNEQEDGPAAGVARLSVLNGDVSVRRGDSGDIVAAAVNAPLVVEDRVYTGTGSRAEVQFDFSNAIRLSSDTELRLAQLDYRRYTMQLARGTVSFRILRDDNRADAEIDTPSVSVRPITRGTYRVSVYDDGTSEITVRSGEAEIFTPRGSERLSAGKTMLVRGDASNPEFQVVAEISRDNWDRWNQDRDRQLESTQAYQYVSRDIYGAEDLDGQGRWVFDPAYGWVWAPYVAAGWAPYRYGRWSWVDWYGWTWVSYDPWGWAPYHYGRWYHRPAYGWCWFPGPIHSRHYWRPALVAFFGFGGGVGLGFGNVGWVPLAPHEAFHPWYGNRYYGGYRSTTYIDNSVHILNNINIRNAYRNARVVNAVTAVDAGGFGRGRVGSYVRVSDEQFNRAAIVRGPLPLAPDRESLRMADREVSRSFSPQTDNARFFSSRQQPARVDRVPFEQQRAALRQASRRVFGGEPGRVAENPAARSAIETGRPAQGNAPGERAAENRGNGWRQVQTPAAAPFERRTEGWRRTDVPARAETVNRGSEGRPAEAPRDSWRSFGAGSGAPPARTETAPPARVEQRSEPRTARPDGNRPDGNWRRDWGRGADQPAREITPRVERFGDPGSVRNESFRLNSPILRERAPEPRVEAPRVASPRTESAPRMEAPRPGTPHMESRGGGGGRSQGESPRSTGGGAGANRGGGESRGGGGGRR